MTNWINEGKLAAYSTPGGHRRIKREDLLLFLRLYQIPVPDELLRKPELAQKTNGDRNAAHEQPSFDEIKSARKMKILIVEDDTNVSHIVKESLAASFPECEIVQAFDGFEAGKQIVSLAPDIILLDLILPGLDGFKVLTNIRQDRNCADIKIIAITGYDTEENRELILQAGGVDGFAPKPIDLNRVRNLIKKLLAK